KAIEVVPIPWLKCWEVYAVALTAAFLLFWAVFGIPPWIEPTAKLTLVMENLAPAVKASDLDVSMRLVGKDPALDERHAASGKREGNALIYTFDWGRVFRGPRWTWGKHYELEAVAKPRS